MPCGNQEKAKYSHSKGKRRMVKITSDPVEEKPIVGRHCYSIKRESRCAMLRSMAIDCVFSSFIPRSQTFESSAPVSQSSSRFNEKHCHRRHRCFFQLSKRCVAKRLSVVLFLMNTQSISKTRRSKHRARGECSHHAHFERNRVNKNVNLHIGKVRLLSV